MVKVRKCLDNVFNELLNKGMRNGSQKFKEKEISKRGRANLFFSGGGTFFSVGAGKALGSEWVL